MAGDSTKNAVKKVGGAATPAAAGTKAKGQTTGGDVEEEKGKADFDLKTAVDAKGNLLLITDDKNEHNGTLSGAPVNFDFKKFKPLTAENFADESAYLEYKANVADARAARLTEQAKKYRTDAQNFRAFGDEKTRKKAKKLEKMRTEYAKIMAELKGDGVTIAMPPELEAPAAVKAA